MSTRYDIAIIGGGPAGLTAARFANRLGKRVVLIEANRLGGDCTWTGCVPSKALLHAANLAHAVRQASHLGIHAAEPTVDFPAVMRRIRDVIQQLYAAESPDMLRAEGIDVIEAHAEFLDQRTVVANDHEITAKFFLICTGASPLIPPIPGLAHAPYLTYESFWQLERLPDRLIIVGGGPIGCELAQAGQRLGSSVTLLEALDRILPNDDPDASALVAASLAADGVDVRVASPVESAQVDNSGAITVTSAGAGIMGDNLLVAVGRRPNVAGLGLDAAGIAHDPRGITVNEHLRTSVKHVYAAGDCTGGFQFTHYAGFQAALAVRNALFPGNSNARPPHVPWAIFTDPEVAQAGYTEQQARNRFGSSLQVATLPLAQVDRAVLDGRETGFIKVMHRPNGAVVGATVVGQRAGEVIPEWALAVQRRMKLSDVATTMHVYPSMNMGNQQLAWESHLRGLTGGVRVKLLRWFSR